MVKAVSFQYVLFVSSFLIWKCFQNFGFYFEPPFQMYSSMSRHCDDQMISLSKKIPVLLDFKCVFTIQILEFTCQSHDVLSTVKSFTLAYLG